MGLEKYGDFANYATFFMLKQFNNIKNHMLFVLF